MRKKSLLILITALFMFGCHNPVKDANKAFETLLNDSIDREVTTFCTTTVFLYKDSLSNFWYPEETTYKDILYDKFKEGFNGLVRLESDVNKIQCDDSIISNSIHELLNQIKIAKEKIKEKQNAIESANSLFLGGVSSFMSFAKLLGSKEDEINMENKGRKMPENVQIAFINLTEVLKDKQRYFAHKINEIENKVFIQTSPTIEEKKEIRANLISLITGRLRQKFSDSNLLWYSNDMIVNLFGYYEKEFKLSDNNSSTINSNTDIPKDANDTLSYDDSSKKSENMEFKVEATFKELVQKWNQGHLTKDMNTFSNMFANSVSLYGTQKSLNECIESKVSLFKRYPDFRQQIYGPIDIVNLNNKEYKCYFTKRVIVNQKATDYPSYLIFGNYNAKWKIIAESDLTTDKNLSKKKLAKTSTYNKRSYLYEPEISVISGVLIIQSYFGTPGYGDNPETDSREYSYILMLEKPIDVISKTENPEEGDFDITKSNLKEIQLTSTQNINFSNYKNKAVRLTGTFFGANTGHHHTEALIIVQKIEEL